MKDTDPTKLKDPVLQFQWAGGSLILGVVLLVIEPALGVITLAMAAIWGATGIIRYLRIKRWLKQRDLA